MSSTYIYTIGNVDLTKFKPTRLYIKRIGNLYYFGKSCTENIERYHGSGVLWKDKIRKYGKDAVLHLWHSDWYFDPEELYAAAIHFSIENDIVNSSMWANLTIETGLDGCHGHSERVKELLSLQKKGKTRSIEAREAISKGKTGKPGYWLGKEGPNKGKTSPNKGKPQQLITCPWCNTTGGNAMKRWHFSNCKLFTSIC